MDIVTVRDGKPFTYRFQKGRRPNILALTCLTGPVLFYHPKSDEPYTDANMLLEKIPGRRVVIHDWTSETLPKYRDFYVQQARALLQDLDQKLKAVPEGSAQAREIEQLKESLRSTIE